MSPYEQAKTVSRAILFLQRYSIAKFAKIACPSIDDYADTRFREYRRGNKKVHITCFSLFIWSPVRVFVVEIFFRKSRDTVTSLQGRALRGALSELCANVNIT